jgi:serine phosphatase RsbU (regulator of sigma subunit)/CheY-like chemotaxis protein
MMGNNCTRVLLIEDDPDDRLLYCEMVQEDLRAGFEVEATDYLAKAEKLLQQKHFDVVLLDLSLPDSQGFTTFETLHDFITAPPIVVLTGQHDEELGLRAVREGAQDYLVKGQVSSDLLVRSMRYAIERKRIQIHQALESRVLKLLGKPPVDREALDRILTEIRQALPVYAIGVRLREETHYPFVVSQGFREEFLHEANSLVLEKRSSAGTGDEARECMPECMCELVIRGELDASRPCCTEGGSFWTNEGVGTIRDICPKPGHGQEHRLCVSPEHSSLALIPIPNGVWQVGLLHVRMEPHQTVDLETVKFLEDLGESIGIALARERAAHGMRSYAERLEGLREVDAAILSAGSLEEIACAALERTGNILPFDHASIVAFEQKGKEEKVLGFFHHHSDEQELEAADAFAAAIAESVRLARGVPLVVEDTRDTRGSSALNQTLSAAGIRSYVTVPLIASNELIGCLNLGWQKSNTIHDNSVEMAEELGEVLSIAIGQRHEQQRREQMESTLHQVDYEMSVARSIQQRFYPEDSVRIGGYEIGGHCEPAHRAGGDYYDYLQLPDGAVGVCIGDVVGHGVGAAVLMASIRSYMHACCRMTADPAEILGYINDLMFRETPANLFCSLCMARLDPTNHSLTFINAGHPSGHVTGQDGTWRASLDSTTFPLGLMEHPDFPSGPEINLKPGEIVCLFTDGVPDATSPSGQNFRGQTENIIAANRSRPARDIATTICEEVQNWSAPRTPHDDVTAVIIKVL